MAGINHVAVKSTGDKGLASEWNADHEQKGNHDCAKFQHLNHVIENRTTFPGGPVEGQIIYRTDQHTLYHWNDTRWVSIVGLATVVVAADGSGDTTDIQEGVDLLPAAGGVVYIKEGSYIITAPITITSNNISIIGSGLGTRIITTADITMIDASGGIRGIFLDKFRLEGDVTQAANIGISFDEVSVSTIRDVEIILCGSHGISCVGGSFNLITGCRIVGNIGNGLLIDGGAGAGAAAYTIVSCSIGANSLSGIYMDDVFETNISGNEIGANLNYGIYGFDNQLINIFGNNIVANVFDGIRLVDFSYATIDGNHSHNNDPGDLALYSGIFFDNVDSSIVTDNNCTGNSNFGIDISNIACSRNIIVSNHSVFNDTGQINDAGALTEQGHNITA